LPDTIQFKNGNQLINQYDATGGLLLRESVTLHSPMSVPLTNVCTYSYDADVMSLEKELYIDNCEYTLQQRGSETIIWNSRFNNNEAFLLMNILVKNKNGYLSILTTEAYKANSPFFRHVLIRQKVLVFLRRNKE
jgi:hypothetical protein